MNKEIKTIEYYMSIDYPIKIHKELDGSYFIEYPDLEGCFSCGETIDVALKMAEDAKKTWILDALNDGIFVPEPRTIESCPDNYKIHLPKSLYRQLAIQSKQEGCSMNQYCVYLLAQGCTK